MLRLSIVGHSVRLLPNKVHLLGEVLVHVADGGWSRQLRPLQRRQPFIGLLRVQPIDVVSERLSRLPGHFSGEVAADLLVLGLAVETPDVGRMDLVV